MRTRIDSTIRWTALVLGSASVSAVYSQYVREFETIPSRLAIGVGLVVAVAALVAIDRRLLRGQDPALADHLAGVAAAFALAQMLAFIAMRRTAWLADEALVPGIGWPGALVLAAIEGVRRALVPDRTVAYAPIDAFFATLGVAGVWTLVALGVARITRFVAKNLRCPPRTHAADREAVSTQ